MFWSLLYGGRVWIANVVCVVIVVSIVGANVNIVFD